MESTIIQTSNQKDQGIPFQKEGGNQGRIPKPTHFPKKGRRTRKKNWRKPYSPSYRIPKIQKDAMDNVFNMARTLIEFKDKEEKRMRQPHFPQN
ncbi:hypothetical protein O181_095187 [Austropuccinia psidii MF-1]|uniref:Uncharacterized protein n=1 Tax=Austropuccinia psidii MF-1 TaxID=1389203 RepID=A0A9Q3PC89_9BASI|nr:hypothetical protein [Austropuccinia psidii MF-1]